MVKAKNTSSKASKAVSNANDSRKSGRRRNEVNYNDEQVIENPNTLSSSASTSSNKNPKNHPKIEIYDEKCKIPTKSAKGELHFTDYDDFRPNLTPAEVLNLGSFGGTYFRKIYSSITEKNYTASEAIAEYPSSWFENMSEKDIKTKVTSSTYNKSINTYDIKCGQSLDAWESSGWITEADPYGWFQWYCRFYLGRRCSDDERQIARGKGVFSNKGRWRNNLINKVINQGIINKNWSVKECIVDKTISPTIRQLLQHWGYRLTSRDLVAALKLKKVPYREE